MKTKSGRYKVGDRWLEVGAEMARARGAVKRWGWVIDYRWFRIEVPSGREYDSETYTAAHVPKLGSGWAVTRRGAIKQATLAVELAADELMEEGTLW